METGDDRIIHEIAQDLAKSYKTHGVITKIDERKQAISKQTIADILEKLRNLLFPGFFDRKRLRRDMVNFFTGDAVEEIIYHLNKQIARALNQRANQGSDVNCEARGLTYKFMKTLPKIRSLLQSDVEAFYDGDPAAFSTDEIILSYPGLYALTAYRLAHELYLLKTPLIPRMMTERAHSLTGIDIHPGATIGGRCFMDHGTGIVVGETTVIGENVKIYQGVTLGALSTKGGQSLKDVKRHPTVKDNVTIYAGASILGGDTVVGYGVTIGSNAFIIKSVPENTKVSVRNPELRFADAYGVKTAELTADYEWYYII